jgi:hypothetical protein
LNPPRRHRAAIGLSLLAAILATAFWLGEPLGPTTLDAAPAAQAQPAGTRGPQPTRSLEDERLKNESDLLYEQRKKLERERDTAMQPWRAPAEAVAAFGPTLVGLGFLALAWRALNHFLPPRPERPRPAEAEAAEDDEDDL